MEKVDILKDYLSQPQYEWLKKLSTKSQEENFANLVIEDVAKTIKQTPDIYEQDGKGFDARVYLHYFRGGSDWFITELDKENKTAFGYTILNNDYEMAELGYFSIEELVENNIELDLFWTQKTLKEAIKDKKG